MHKGKTYTINQDRRSLAALSVVALCLKTLLPFISAVLLSHAASAQTQLDGSSFENNPKITQSLQFICTPTGIIIVADSNDATSTNYADHCDHCIMGGFLSLGHATNLIEARHSFIGLLAWHITDQDKNLPPQGYALPASRAPPAV